MLARDHALSGALAFAAAAPALHITGPGLLAGVVFTAGAATAPDIDEPGSTISRTLGFFTEGAAWAIHKISGGHRKGTHSLLGAAVLTAASWIAVRAAIGIPGKIVLGLILAVVLTAGARALHLGRFHLSGHHGDLTGLTAAAAAIWWHTGLALVPVCMAIGAAAHIAGDELTHSGCPLAWPASSRPFHLLPRRLQITTGRFAEHWIVSTLLLAGLGFLICHDIGMTGIVGHPGVMR